MRIKIAMLVVVAFVWLVASAVRADATEIGLPIESECYVDEQYVEYEYEKKVVDQEKIVEIEYLFVKQVKVFGHWVVYDNGSVTRWENEDFTEEGWIGLVRYRYVKVEPHQTREVVVQEEISHVETMWSETDPGEPWVATGESREQTRQVEVECGITATADTVCDEGLNVVITNTGGRDETVLVNGVEVQVPAGETVTHTFDLPTEDTGWIVYVDWLRGPDDKVWVGTFEGTVDCDTPPSTTPTTWVTIPEPEQPTPPGAAPPAPTLPVTGAATPLIVGIGSALALIGVACRGLVRWAKARIEP